MSQTLQNQILNCKSMNGIITLSDGNGTIISNGSISTGGINATSIYSDEYNTRGKSKMESTIIIASSSTPYTISYGTAQNIVFTGSVIQTVNLPQVFLENMGATFTIIRTSAVQMIINAPSGYSFYDETNAFQTAVNLGGNNRIVTFTAINTTASPAMWSMTYSQLPNSNLTMLLAGNQNITGNKTFSGTTTITGTTNFSLLPFFTGTLGAVASNNFITKDIGNSLYQAIGNYATLGGANIFTNINTFNNGVYINNALSVDTTNVVNFNNTANPLIGYALYNFTANTYTSTMLNNTFTQNVGIQNGSIDALTITNTAIFSGAIPKYTGSSTAYANNTFFPRSYGDTRYAQLATNNTLTGVTTFTGDIVANSQTITPTELGYLDGVTANIQTQLNSAVFLAGNQLITGNKTISGTTTFTGNISANSQTITPTELGYLDSATSNIQTQLNNCVTLNTTQSITAIKQFNNNVGIFGFFVPNVQTSTTSMRIGQDSLLYNTSSSCTDNIAWGTNALRGDPVNLTKNLTKQNIAIGTNAGESLYYTDGTSATNTDDNVIIGYRAGRAMYSNSNSNVLIGSKCGSINDSIRNCVFLGPNICSTGGGYMVNSVIIGSNTLTSAADQASTTIVGANSLPTCGGNGNTAFGAFCGKFAVVNDTGMWLGGECGNYVASGWGSIFCGYNSGNSLGSGGGNGFFGINSNTTNSSIQNSYAFGYNCNVGENDTFKVGGINLYTDKSMDLLIANKNRLLKQEIFTTVTATLTFEMGENIFVDTSTTNINLPTASSSNNIGTRFTIYRDFNSNTLTITSPSGDINNTGTSASTYVLDANECFVTLVCVGISPFDDTWYIVNQDLNAFIQPLFSKTTAITYNDTSSPAYTSITSQLRLNNNAVKFQTSATLTGTVGSLSTPLNSVYILSGATGSLTLPSITTDLIGVRITFVKQDATGTWTLSRSSTNTFRFQGSTTTATSLPMARTWTMCELIAESGVWNIINQNAGVDGYYYRDEISPTNITANITTWTNPIYETYLVNNTANITISLPLSSQVFIGLVLRFRKIGTLTATLTLNIQSGSGQSIKFAGATANSTTGTLLSASQTFASVMYISSNLWAVLG